MQPRKNVDIKTDLRRPYNTPSRRLCKRLFDSVDPYETKRMVEDMVEAERKRLKDVWNFGASTNRSAATEAYDLRQNEDRAPMFKKRQYEWQVQDRHEVPHFYSRSFYRHQSEIGKLRRTRNVLPTSHIQKKLFHSNENDSSPQPLTCNDANTNPVNHFSVTSLLKDDSAPLSFSPPRLSVGNENRSISRHVTALRIPLPTMTLKGEVIQDAVTSKNLSGHLDHGSNMGLQDSNATGDAKALTLKAQIVSDFSVSERSMNKNKRRKRCKRDSLTNQQKISDLLPVRKLRSNAAKRPRQEKNHQIQVESSK